MGQNLFDSIPVQLTERLLRAEKDLRDIFLQISSILTSIATLSAKKAPLVIGGHGNGGTIPAGLTYYIVPTIAGLDTVGRSWPFPLAATTRNLYFRLATAQPGTGSLVITIQDVSLPGSTGVTITIPAGSAAGTYTDLTHTYTWTAGNLIQCSIQNNASGASGTVGGVSWEMDVALV